MGEPAVFGPDEAFPSAAAYEAREAAVDALVRFTDADKDVMYPGELESVRAEAARVVHAIAGYTMRDYVDRLRPPGQSL
jgi:hypothetical protein